MIRTRDKPVDTGCSVRLSTGPRHQQQALAPEVAALSQQLMPGMNAELPRRSGELHSRLCESLVTLSVVAG